MRPGRSPWRRLLDDYREQTGDGLRRAVAALTANYSGFVDGDISVSLTTLPTLTTTARPAAPWAATISAQAEPSIRITTSPYVRDARSDTGLLDDHREQPDDGLRRAVADLDRQLQRVRQRRQPASLTRTDPDDDGEGRQPRGQRRDRRKRSRRSELQHHLYVRDARSDIGLLGDHREQPDDGLRRAVADIDRQLQRVRQRRHPASLGFAPTPTTPARPTAPWAATTLT